MKVIHDKRDLPGNITVTLEADDWVWLCELLSEVVAQEACEEMLREDAAHAISALQSFEAGV